MNRADIDIFGSTAKSVRHAADIVAAMAPPSKPATSQSAALVTTTPQERTPSIGKSVVALAPAVAGAAAGAVLWRKHRVLGALAGHALASNALPLYRGEGKERTTAICRLGTETAGIAASLAWKAHPIIGWCAGILAGTVVSSFVPGTPMNDEWHRVKKEWTGR